MTDGSPGRSDTAVKITYYTGRMLNVNCWPLPSVRLFYAQQLKILSDLKYFLPLSLRYSVIADGHITRRSF